MIRIIGVNGIRYAGKDTFFQFLQELDASFIRFAFADPLKEDLCKMLGITRAQFELRKPRYRKLMQEYGMIMRETHGYDYWINRTRGKVDHALSRGDNVVLTDARLDNEFDYIKSYPQSHLIHIYNKPALDSALADGETHISESIAMDDAHKSSRFDMVLDNSSSLDYFKRIIANYYAETIKGS